MSSSSEYLQWQGYTKAGNECFNNGNIKSAKSHYHVALSLSNNLLSAHSTDKAAVCAMLVAHHNLATLLAQQTQCGSAYSLLKQAQQRLEQQLNNANDYSDQSALLWGLSKNHREIMIFIKTYSFSPVALATQSLN
ncbi:hypothetical protein [Pseudoalteromonas carrageenovora]|uniref:hypothetical protein n=1 Tax=Pseudoalteromonas carrageenovora TaxID=227 RepID=UPI0026E448B5|nr:hypothetical protein [Pseudoalteromonas carrageenovora]MDO6546372.1 hypothetical protein [Pseudoalteromonas carrageenovora]MDO6830911.1 hypothetical protein [Pseudoalteromonas carrageenovora]